MPKARQIQKRLKAVRNIRTISRTMEMIAAARFKRVHDRAVRAKAVAGRLEELLRSALAAGGELTHPLLRPGKGDDRAVVVVTSNRGLCGGYNNRVLDLATETIAGLLAQNLPVRFIMVGRKGAALLRYRHLPKPQQTLEQFEGLDLPQRVDEFARDLIREFLSGELASAQVVHQRMLSAGTYRPDVATLLPVAVAPPAEPPPPYEFAPSPAGALGVLLAMAARARLLGYFLDAALSEQIARMTAMRAATSNADDMIRALTGRINRLRQTQITMELAEIMGGAEALRE